MQYNISNFNDIECRNVYYKKLGEVLKIKNGKDYKQYGAGDVPVYGSGGIMTYIDTFAYDKPSVLIPRKGSLDKLYYVETPFWNVDTVFYTVIDEKQVIPKYVYYFLEKQHLERLNKSGGVPSLTQSVLNEIIIPVPNLSRQREIVEILDKLKTAKTELINNLLKEVDLRNKQYCFFRDRLFEN